MYVVFDRYFYNSIKSMTHSSRAVCSASRQHQLSLQTPLSAQNDMLTVTRNKIQLIDMKCNSMISKKIPFQGKIRGLSSVAENPPQLKS